MRRFLAGCLLYSIAQAITPADNQRTSALFIEYGIGGRMGLAKNGTLSVNATSPLPNVGGAPSVSFYNASFHSGVHSINIGGDYAFSNFSLGLIGGYAFSGGHLGEIGQVGGNNVPLQARGYPHLGLRFGLRYQPALFFAKIGSSFPAFSGAFDLDDTHLGKEASLFFKTKSQTFLCLGGGIDITLVRHFAVGITYNWHIGKVNFKHPSSTIFNPNYFSTLDSSITSKHVQFSEVLATFKYLFPVTW